MSELSNDAVYDMKLQARRYRWRHDNNFYGPMKGVRCGCAECQLAQYVITLADAVFSTRAGHGSPSGAPAVSGEAGTAT